MKFSIFCLKMMIFFDKMAKFCGSVIQSIWLKAPLSRFSRKWPMPTHDLFKSEFTPHNSLILGRWKERFFEVNVILLYKTSTPLICTNCIVHYSKNVTVLLSEVVCCDEVWSISLAWSWQMSGSEIMDESLINPHNGTTYEQSQKHSELLIRYLCATLVMLVST